MSQFFYSGAIRKYVAQTIRVLSNFTVKYGDGSLRRIPVFYGDSDRQVANIRAQNSENTINSIPRISVYISGLALDRERLGDATFVGKIRVQERAIDPVTDEYTTEPGNYYTVERMMPTPFKLTLKIDILASSTDQKLQILEQLLVFFNPSIEIQTSSNWVDWTSLSVINLVDVNWSSRSVPVGTDSPIDVATITVETPAWISPPVKVTRKGVITHIITNIWDGNQANLETLIDGVDTNTPGSATDPAVLTRMDTMVEEYDLTIFNNQAMVWDKCTSIIDDAYGDPEIYGDPLNWNKLLTAYHSKFVDGLSRIFLIQSDGHEVVGTFKIDPTDETKININWDIDTMNKNTGIDSDGNLEYEPMYDLNNCCRANSPGTFDAIINPQTYNPKRPVKQDTDQPIPVGIRYMLIDDIGHDGNQDGADGWKSIAGLDFVARTNDIIEWTGRQWVIIFTSQDRGDNMVWQTNTYTGIQYMWNGIQWKKSYEGIYRKRYWKLELQ